MNELRELLYPLGYLAAMAFGGRFLLQWVASEVQQRSVVTRAFWRLSLCGNILLMIHSFLQSQFHVSIVQACNSVISWRNLNLMQPKEEQVSLQKVIQLLLASAALTTSLFILQSLMYDGSVDWFRLPTPSWSDSVPVHVGASWHIVGFVGLILFSSRFWVQWIQAERYQQSNLGPLFWWLSLIGGLATLVYFVKINDPVNIIGPAFGLVPYIRNLMLIYKKRTPARSFVGAT